MEKDYETIKETIERERKHRRGGKKIYMMYGVGYCGWEATTKEGNGEKGEERKTLENAIRP